MLCMRVQVIHLVLICGGRIGEHSAEKAPKPGARSSPLTVPFYALANLSKKPVRAIQLVRLRFAQCKDSRRSATNQKLPNITHD
jgi:hypothetical protein